MIATTLEHLKDEKLQRLNKKHMQTSSKCTRNLFILIPTVRLHQREITTPVSDETDLCPELSSTAFESQIL